MATRNINVQYLLRGDTLANLTSANKVYGNREPVIVFVPADGSNPAKTLLKIGDGTTAFNSLPYISALSNDVVDTDTQYKLEQDATDGHILKFYAKAKGDADFPEEPTATITIPDNDTTYTAADKSVVVDATNHTIGVKLSNKATNALKLETTGEETNKGLLVELPDDPVISVVKKTTANEGYLTSYQVTVDGTAVGVDIDIPKDYLVKSASVEIVEEADKPYSGAVVGEKYIDFVVNTKDSDAEGTKSHIYIPIKDIVTAYTQGDGIEISGSNVVSLKIDTANANGLDVTSAGLKLGVATDSLAGAMSAADHTRLSGMSDGANKVEASQTPGKIKIDGVETVVAGDATTGASGLMSATDKGKLDGVKSGANKIEAATTNGYVKVDGTDDALKVYELPNTVLDSGDTFVFDGGNA